MPVVDNGEPVGIVSDRDVKMASKFDRFVSLTAADIMTPEPYTVSPATSLDKVVFENTICFLLQRLQSSGVWLVLTISHRMFC